MPEEALIKIATKDEDSDEMRATLEEALELSFLTSGPHGVSILVQRENPALPVSDECSNLGRNRGANRGMARPEVLLQPKIFDFRGRE